MLKHNLHIIFRNFKRNKSSFFINLIGLSTGLACALLIYLWVSDELHVDKFYAKDKQLYQVMLNQKTPNGIVTIEFTPGLLAQALAEKMPEIEYATAIEPKLPMTNEGILSFDNIKLKANEHYASKDFFHTFSYRIIEGSINQVLFDKSSVLISDEIARRLFGSTKNVIGKTIQWENKIFDKDFTGFYQISGVFAKPPSNSSDQFDVLFSYELFCEKWGENNINNWTNNISNTYLVMKEGSDVEQFNGKIADFIKSKNNNANCTLFVRPYSDKYLYNNYEDGVLVGGRITYVRLFSIIALFILVIACINFINMSTAKAAGRFKEVGIKKTVGANRKALLVQYLGESLMMVFLSMMFALVLVEVLLPQFNQVTGKHLELTFDFKIILTILVISIFTGLAAGSYPAFYLSGFNPAVVLKGKISTSVGELLTRKGLVIFQFIISVILIVSVIVVYKQIEFIQNKNLGFTKNHILCFKRDETIEKNFDAFLSELKNIPGVINASNSSNDFIGTCGTTTGGIIYRESNQILFANIDVSYDFFETLGIETNEGRTFSKEFGSESSSIILNETGIKSLGIRDPIGKTVKIWGESRQIIGVVKDFNFESLYEKVKPSFFRIMNPNFNFANNIWVRIQAGTERETIMRIQNLYNEFNPGLALEYRFLDSDFERLYKSENHIAVLSRYFAGMAIIISCLGLFGLAAFTAEKRRKEIGIRKALGSSEFGIIQLLTNDFTKIVLASMLISLPVSYFIAKHWLDSFAYRIEIHVWYFIGAGLITLSIAWLTVGFQAIKAATANPVESLRYE
jgi:putative ABC transport system permease protein